MSRACIWCSSSVDAMRTIRSFVRTCMSCTGLCARSAASYAHACLAQAYAHMHVLHRPLAHTYLCNICVCVLGRCCRCGARLRVFTSRLHFASSLRVPRTGLAGEYGLGYYIQKQRKLAAAVLHSAAASLAAAKGQWERRAIQQPPPGAMTTAIFWAWPPISPDEIPQGKVMAPTDREGRSRGALTREALTREALGVLPRGPLRGPLPREPLPVIATSAPPSDATLEATVKMT